VTRAVRQRAPLYVSLARGLLVGSAAWIRSARLFFGWLGSMLVLDPGYTS
jgi:hypothetical protein